jgi:glucokinase
VSARPASARRAGYIAGDVGGTNARLQAGVAEAARPRVQAERSYASGEFDGMAALLRRFAADAAIELDTVAAVTLAVAGPVSAGRARMTNLPWTLDAAELERELGIGRVQIVNDFIAAAHGVVELDASDVEPIRAGEAAPRGARLVLGAGTGLGVAALVPAGDGYAAVPSEAGHMDFAPAGDDQRRVAEALARRYGHVSCERLLSGPGLEAIHCVLGGGELERPPLTAGEITVAARAGDPLAGRALALFVSVYGAVAGNLALAFLATGGVYIAGGIAPAIAAELRGAGFTDAFVDKGRFRGLLERVPVSLVKNPRLGLLGAAAHAAWAAYSSGIGITRPSGSRS